jgi:hypothetical protein
MNPYKNKDTDFIHFPDYSVFGRRTLTCLRRILFKEESKAYISFCFHPEGYLSLSFYSNFGDVIYHDLTPPSLRGRPFRIYTLEDLTAALSVYITFNPHLTRRVQ